MKHVAIVCSMLLIPLCVFANRKTDSLLNIVQKYKKQPYFESNTNYNKVLIAVAENMQNAQPDTSFLFSNKSYELSKICEYSKGIQNSSLSISVLFLNEGNIQKLFYVVYLRERRLNV